MTTLLVGHPYRVKVRTFRLSEDFWVLAEADGLYLCEWEEGTYQAPKHLLDAALAKGLIEPLSILK